MKNECPHESAVKVLQAGFAEQKIEIKSQRLKIEALQAKYDLLTIAQIKEEAEKCGLLKGMRIAAIVIGYTIISLALMAVGHVVGFTELIIKVLKF